jgi:hypothetical protein
MEDSMARSRDSRSTRAVRTLEERARELACGDGVRAGADTKPRGAEKPRRQKPGGGEPPRGAEIRPGALQPVAALARGNAEELFRLALRRACGDEAPDAPERGVLWHDAGDSIVLYVSRSRLLTTERLIVVTIPIYTDQSAAAEVVMPFVTSAPDDGLGLMAAAETKPRGPAAVIDVFGDALVMVAWAALVETAAAWAAAAGRDAVGLALEPAGLAASKAGLVVHGQAPFLRGRRP